MKYVLHIFLIIPYKTSGICVKAQVYQSIFWDFSGFFVFSQDSLRCSGI